MNLSVKADSIFSPEHGFIRDKVLLIKDGIIEKIAGASEIGNGIEVLDFSGSSISPPFYDHHLHFSSKQLAEIDDVLHALRTSGILRAAEGGDRNLSGLEMKKALQGRVDVLTSGAALYREGGYGRAIGEGVKDLQEARLVIDRLHASAVDYIKVINSGIFMPDSGEFSTGGFERDELKEIVTHAEMKGLSVTCHANGDKAVRDAVESGASAIVHGFLVSDETLSMMAKGKVAFIPTVTALLSLMTVTGNLRGRKRIEELADGHLETLKRAKERGVSVLPGSDSGPPFIPYGTSFSQELALFKRAGFKTEEILSCSVTEGLKEGSRANFLVLDGLSVRKVFINGVCFC